MKIGNIIASTGYLQFLLMHTYVLDSQVGLDVFSHSHNIEHKWIFLTLKQQIGNKRLKHDINYSIHIASFFLNTICNGVVTPMKSV